MRTLAPSADVLLTPRAEHRTCGGLGLATRATVGETDFRFVKIGCNERAYVLAWVDLDESEGFDALVANNDYDGWEEQTEEHGLHSCGAPW